MGKTAIVFGASGLIGSQLLPLLFADDQYDLVLVFTRKSLGIVASKLEEIITDFKDLDELRKQVKGDVVFCCLGTTIKTAGSEKAFRRVDFELVRWAAVAASENKVKRFLVVSSMGADADSKNFYLRTKGEMELAVSALNFEKCVILRPSMLLGPRKETRVGERIGQGFMVVFGIFIPAKYKAIQAATVAKAMVISAADDNPGGIMMNDQIRRFR
ncbi:MAG TPA: NAD(P)H-binding protein [Bacteroidia bacterium]|nr:NAD(P)H-binding protein [Bacteroidia bacterium]